jgi:hypothetical protein
MAKIGVSLKINVSEIDKARLFKGKKGYYLDATVFIDVNELDQYGNSGMITQDVSKEEKAQNVKGNILGNCKVFWNDSGQAPQQAPAQQSQQPAPQQQAQPQRPPQPQNNGYQQAQNQAPQQQPAAPQPAQQNGFSDFDDDVPF